MLALRVATIGSARSVSVVAGPRFWVPVHPAIKPLLSYGFEITVDSGLAQAEFREPPATFGTDIRRLGPEDAARLRTRLAQAVVGTVASAPESGHEWDDARSLTVRLRQTGGGWTRLIIPLKPFTLPLGNNPRGADDLRQSVERLLEAAWPGIVDAAPK